MEPGSACACASARSRLSTTGSHCNATLARVSISARLTWLAHFLRMLSRSARARSRRSSSSAIRCSLAAADCAASVWVAGDTAGGCSADAGPLPPGPVPADPVPADGGRLACAGIGSLAPPVPCPLPAGADPWPDPGFLPRSLIGAELGVDDILVAGQRLRSFDIRCWLRAQALEQLCELGVQHPDPLDRRVLLQCLSPLSDHVVRSRFLIHRNRITAVSQQALYPVRQRIQFVPRVGQLTQPQVLLTVVLGIADHALDLSLVKIRALTDCDALLSPGVLITGGDVQYAVGIDVEDDFDMRRPSWRWPDVLEPEPAENPVVGCAFPFALQHDNVDRRLVVLRGAEYLGAPRRDRGVALDDLRHHSAECLDAQRQRSDIEQQDILDLALEHRSLGGRPERDDLVRVDGHVRVLAAGKPPNLVLHC